MEQTLTLRITLKGGETMELTFEREKETKNTIRFQEVGEADDPKVIGPLYVQKWALKELGNPDSLTVTVTATAEAVVEVPKTRTRTRAAK
jgi:hypothetical protein